MASIGVALLLSVAAFSAAIAFLHAAPRFPRPPYQQPSRLYAQPTRLAVGAPYEPRLLVEELAAEGYREERGGSALPAGTYRLAEAAGPASGPTSGPTSAKPAKRVTVALHLRRFPTLDGGDRTGGGAAVEAAFATDREPARVTALAVAGRPVASVELEPALLASYYGPHVEERHPVALAELPAYVPRAVLAAEDARFYDHAGVSVAAIARAAWVDLAGGAVAQGGSTLTQQLVKNLYLTHRRTLSRKAREVLLALLVELRHDKREILEAYLNEIYWGKRGPANLIGLGAAARAYFGKDPASLSLAEAATLAGMIRSPRDYSPVDHPERAIDRRNAVLMRMVALGWAKRDRALAAAGEPLPPAPPPVAGRIAPYFADAAADEAAARFGLHDLADRGYLLFSTLRFGDQRRAEEAMASGLEELETSARHSGRSARKAESGLQSALVSTDPRDGAILAYVGGRDYAASQFDRVTTARRPPGSAWKPIVYAAAFAESAATPATYLEDSPIVVRYGTERWSPQDYDHSYHGWVTARAALEQSLNVPAVRVALSVGLDRVVELARAMGVESPLDPVPSLALGAFAVSPREMAAVYSTLANGGERPPIHGLAAVRDGRGEAVAGDDPPPPRRVLEPQVAYLVTSILQGVLDRGTGQAARREGIVGALAGKTGTTNGRRDNWFAGYSPDRATVVWVGYDDDSASHLSGSTAALPIWSRFTAAVRPAGGYPPFVPPAGLVTATVDPTTGQLATTACPTAVTDLFLEWRAPRETCATHPGAELGSPPALLAGLDSPSSDVSDPSDTATASADTLIVGAEGPGARPATGTEGTIVIRRSIQAAQAAQPAQPPQPAQTPETAESPESEQSPPPAEDSADPPPPPP
jgi:penicillin-binding protein 1B